jgi:3-hydroxy-3-methylglutaryl CoA synthase
MASTTMPFADRQNAVIVKEALNLDDDLSTLDITGSQRTGVSALIQALAAASSGTAPVLCVAAEKPRARPASEAELVGGAGAAALLVGSGPVIARHLFSHSLSADFIDHFRAEGRPFDYEWEARWVREEGYGKLAPRAIAAVLSRAGLRPEEIDVLILPAPIRGVANSVAKQCGIRAEAVADDLATVVGHAGAAQPLVLLAHALEKAEPRQRILLVGFGSGCDVVLLERTDLKPAQGPALGVRGWLARRKPETNYSRYLFLSGGVEFERGMRAEFDQKQPLTALWRNRRTVLGLVGGRCKQTGTVQFPRSEIGVSSNSHSVGTQEDHFLAERTARILTHTADHLTYTPDPPAYYGMIEFEEGGRMNAEFCDVDADEISVGREMRMMFRIKAQDELRGFTRYFWKAAPVGRQMGE